MTEAVQAMADVLEHLGAPFSLPEDWILLCDNDDLRHMPRAKAKRLLAQAKKETAQRWLAARFDPAELDQELFAESESADESEVSDHRALKRHAIRSIDDVVSTVTSSREAFARLANDNAQPSAHAKTVAARLAYGYPAGRPERTDCFDHDVRRQCQLVIDEIYSPPRDAADPGHSIA